MRQPAAYKVVMLVEDDPDIAAIVSLSLQLDPQLEVIAMPSGRAALDRLSRAPRPDLILIDNHLPDMDGVAFATALAASARARPPIAFLTAAVRPSDRERYDAVGAIAVIAKPFEPTLLASQVRALLGAT